MADLFWSSILCPIQASALVRQLNIYYITRGIVQTCSARNYLARAFTDRIHTLIESHSTPQTSAGSVLWVTR
jgi:hypothetical protein